MDVGAVRKIGRYPVERFIAEGGMAWVFRVADPDLFNAPRALKLLKPEAAQGEDYQRFIAEAQILATIQHPNLIQVFDFGTDEATGCHFYTMDFIEGQTLSDIPPNWLDEDQEDWDEEDAAADVAPADPEADPNATAYINVPSTPKKVRYTVRDVLEYFSGVLAALSRLHRANVIHRDIKPENIFLSHDGIAVLGDLGIAKGRYSSSITEAGRVPGTPLFMSPEHARGEPTNARSDIFSVGLSLYAVLSGETIYEQTEGVEASESQSVLRHLITLATQHEEFDFVFHDSIPDAVCDAIEKACSIDPQERYASADEFQEDLRNALDGTREVVTSGARTWIAAGAAVVFLAIAGYFAWDSTQRDSRNLETEQALEEARTRAELAEKQRKEEEGRLEVEREKAREVEEAAKQRLAALTAELEAAEQGRQAEEERIRREREKAEKSQLAAQQRLALLQAELQEEKNRPKPEPIVVAAAEKDAELRDVMRKYETAYEARSITDLNRVWTMSRFERLQVERLFNNCDQIRVQISFVDSNISGATGRVDYDETIVYRECDEGRGSQRYSELSASFARRGDDWQIKAIRER